MRPHSIVLRVVELQNWELGAFLLTTHFAALGSREANVARLSATVQGRQCDVRLGFVEIAERLHGFTELSFEWPMTTSLGLFERSAHPTLVHGPEASEMQAGGDIERVDFDGEADEARLYSKADSDLIDAQESEDAVLSQSVRAILPFASAVINEVRKAVRLELYENATKFDFMVEGIKATQRQFGGQLAEMDADLDDTAFLLSAFPRRGLSRLTQETQIEFSVTDEFQRTRSGNIQGSRSGRTPAAFLSSIKAIQGRLDSGSSPMDSSELTAVEALYSDDFAIAVFHAAVVLEIALNRLFKRMTNPHARQGIALKQEYKRFKQEHKLDTVPAWASFLLPRALDKDALQPGVVDRCIEAWEFRNKVVAHLTTPRAGEELSRDTAWALVVAVFAAVRAIGPTTSGP